MMHKLFLVMLVISSGIYAGEQSKVNRQHCRSQSRKPSKRGKKRNQRKMLTLEQSAREKFPGPDVQLAQRVHRTSSERRKRAKAWQELVLLEETGRAGSVEQCAAVTVLLKAKVHPDMKYLKECGISFKGSPLCNAAAAGNVELSKVLLGAGADANLPYWYSSKRGYGKELPIHAAARLRKDQTEFDGHYPEMITLLYEHGADVNLGGETQEFPFAPIHMVALQRPQRGEGLESQIARQTATLQALIECGADLEKKTFHGATAVELAMKRGNPDIARFLGSILEVHNKNRFIEHFVSARGDASPEGIRRLRKAAQAITKSRHLKEQLKKQCGPTSSSRRRDEY